VLDHSEVLFEARGPQSHAEKEMQFHQPPPAGPKCRREQEKLPWLSYKSM